VKLPEDSHIAPEKLSRYLLVPQARGDKAAYLALAGYTLDNFTTLLTDLPAHELRRGDVVRLIDRHAGPDGKMGYSIEVFNAVGDTVAVTVVDEDAIEALRSDEVLSVRRIKSAAA
jgi:hypothetical protein